MMSTDTESKEVTESTSLPADVTDDSRRLEIVRCTSLNTDGPCTTECDSGDWPAKVKQENLPVVKQEPDDVCCIGLLSRRESGLVYRWCPPVRLFVCLSVCRQNAKKTQIYIKKN